MVAGAPLVEGGDATLWSAFDLVVTGTVVDIETNERRDSGAYGATVITFDVINAMGVASIDDRVLISSIDPGWVNGYAFEVGSTYFVPLKSPGPAGQRYWSFLCDPISRITPSDAAELTTAVMTGVPTATPGGLDSPEPRVVEPVKPPAVEYGVPAGPIVIAAVVVVVVVGVAGWSVRMSPASPPTAATRRTRE